MKIENSMERTLVILKPGTIQRRLIGEIISRFEKKGLILTGMKMIWLSDEILSEHYVHLKEKPFFQKVKNSMQANPVIICCWEGIDAVNVVRTITGVTNGRLALPGTIRGDYSMSMQENIIHASDSLKTAENEINRFFNENELFNYETVLKPYLYAKDEV
jgi:nucleoside-diphosphate kinase